MTPTKAPDPMDTLVEIDYRLTLVELCSASAAREDEVLAWIEEGALAPDEVVAGEWRFAASTLRRTAARLAHDFEIDAPAVALVLRLMDEIERLKGRLG